MTRDKIFKAYHFELDKSDIKCLEADINEHGIKEMFDKYKRLLDCSKRDKYDKPIIQTIDCTYRVYLAKALYLIQKASDKDAPFMFNYLMEIHLKNLEYEKNFPPIVYDTVKPIKKVSKKRISKVTQLKMNL